MTGFAFRTGDTWVEITGAWASMLGDHPPGWIDTATPAERRLSGAVPITEGQMLPHAHQVKLGEELVDVNGQPVRRGLFADLTVEERRAEMTASLRTLWHIHEVSGFTGPGGFLATDELVQRRLLVLLAQPPITITWEIRAGEFVVITEGQLREVADAVFRHLAACATHARELQAEINAARTHARFTAIDLTQGWPP